MVKKSSVGYSSLPRITNYKDLRLRKPRRDWRIGRAERWIAEVLAISPEVVRLMLPRGNRRARSSKTLGALRRDWGCE